MPPSTVTVKSWNRVKTVMKVIKMTMRKRMISNRTKMKRMKKLRKKK